MKEGIVWRGRDEAWLLGEKTLLMGVLNVTPDSFSDGGKYLDREAAVSRARSMVEEGADIIDVGGESSRPGAEQIGLDEELTRTIPVVEALASELSTPISIDTTKAGVAKEAIEAGAEIINDISAMRFDPDMVEVAKKYKPALILMHMKGTPETMQKDVKYGDVISEIYNFFQERITFLIDKGVDLETIAIDPGIGFGKGLNDNLRIIKELGTFKALSRPVVLGPSRKSFIGQVLDLSVMERLEGTAAAIAVGVLGGGNILRVHDVKEMRRVVDVVDAIRNA